MSCTPEIRGWFTGALVAVSTGFGGVHPWSSPSLGFDGAYSLELSEGVCCPSRPRCELANRTCRCERPGSARWFAGAHLGFGRPVCAWSSHVIRWSPVAQAPPFPVPPGFIRRSWFTGAHIEIRRGGWSSLCGSVGHSLEPVEPSRCSGAGHWSSLCVLARLLGLSVIRWPFAASVEQGQAAAFPV